MNTRVDRRDFLKAGTLATTSTFLAGGMPTHLLAEVQAEPEHPRSANDQIQLGLIGAGGQGMGDTKIVSS